MVNLEKPSIRKAVNIPASRPHQYPKSDFESLLLHEIEKDRGFLSYDTVILVSETQTTFGFFGNCQFAAMYIPMYLIPRYLYGFLSDFLLVHWPVDLGYIYLATQSLSVTEQMGPYQR